MHTLQMGVTLLFKLGLCAFTATLLGFTHKTFESNFSKGIGLAMTAGKTALIVVPLYFYSFDLVTSYPVSYLWPLTLPALLLLRLHRGSAESSVSVEMALL